MSDLELDLQAHSRAMSYGVARLPIYNFLLEFNGNI